MPTFRQRLFGGDGLLLRDATAQNAYIPLHGAYGAENIVRSRQCFFFFFAPRKSARRRDDKTAPLKICSRGSLCAFSRSVPIGAAAHLHDTARAASAVRLRDSDLKTVFFAASYPHRANMLEMPTALPGAMCTL